MKLSEVSVRTQQAADMKVYKLKKPEDMWRTDCLSKITGSLCTVQLSVTNFSTRLLTCNLKLNFLH